MYARQLSARGAMPPIRHTRPDVRPQLLLQGVSFQGDHGAQVIFVLTGQGTGCRSLSTKHTRRGQAWCSHLPSLQNVFGKRTPLRNSPTREGAMAGPSQGHVGETPPIQRATGTQRRLQSGENTAEGPFPSSCKGENIGGHICASKTVTGALHSPPRWAEPRGLATGAWPSLAFCTASADTQEPEERGWVGI